MEKAIVSQDLHAESQRLFSESLVVRKEVSFGPCPMGWGKDLESPPGGLEGCVVSLMGILPVLKDGLAHRPGRVSGMC